MKLLDISNEAASSQLIWAVDNRYDMASLNSNTPSKTTLSSDNHSDN